MGKGRVNRYLLRFYIVLKNCRLIFDILDLNEGFLFFVLFFSY